VGTSVDVGSAVAVAGSDVLKETSVSVAPGSPEHPTIKMEMIRRLRRIMIFLLHIF
jgi:hypothetical protein